MWVEAWLATQRCCRLWQPLLGASAEGSTRSCLDPALPDLCLRTWLASFLYHGSLQLSQLKPYRGEQGRPSLGTATTALLLEFEARPRAEAQTSFETDGQTQLTMGKQEQAAGCPSSSPKGRVLQVLLRVPKIKINAPAG